MAEREKDKKEQGEDWLPYPETDFSPALQRTLKRKLEEAEATREEESVDRDAFFKALGRVARSRDESSDEGQ